MLAVLALLAVRADARPVAAGDVPGDDDDVLLDTGAIDGGSADEPDGPEGPDEPHRRATARLYIPVSSAMIERVVTFAPPVGAVVQAAYRAAGLAEDPTPSWRRRSRLAKLIPSLSARVGQNQAWRDVLDPTISHSLAFAIGASWHLDDLLFDPNEPRIEAADLARRRQRRRLASYVIHLYFDWVTARAAAGHDLRALLDAQEKAAELDALTAEWFSQTLAKRADLR